MNKQQEYSKLIQKQQEEMNNFPIAYAFNEEQLEQALRKLGAARKECTTVGYGTVIKKSDIPQFNQLIIRHRNDLYGALSDEEFAEEAFLYEMDNHEYAINWSGDEDVLACFNLDENKLKEMGLEGAYRRARKRHYDYARKREML